MHAQGGGGGGGGLLGGMCGKPGKVFYKMGNLGRWKFNIVQGG